MCLKRITNCLLFLNVVYLLHTDAESIRAAEGETVHLPCHSLPDDSEKVTVKWTKKGTTLCDLNFNIKSGQTTFSKCSPRFTLNRTSFTLNIKNVQLSDSGNYSCETSRIIPPPSVGNISSVLLDVKAHIGLSLQLQNDSNDTCVHLICSLESLTPELVNFTWTRKGQGSLHPSKSDAMVSELHLCKPDWSDGDTIICHASFSNNKTQRSIRLTSHKESEKDPSPMWIIVGCSAAAGLILCIILTVVICKCRKRDGSGSIVFSNKVYENFSFAMASQNSRSIPKPQTEECIYEN